MCFIQIFLNPRLVNLIGTAVFGKGVHITSHLFKLFQVLRVVVNEDVLVIDMVTGEQHAHWRSKRQSAIAPVSG